MKTGLLGSLMLLLAVLLTSTTFVLGGAPLLGFRRLIGRAGFAAAVLCVSIAFAVVNMQAFALLWLAQSILVSVFVESDERGRKFELRALMAVVFMGLLIAGGFTLWASQVGPDWYGLLVKEADLLLKPFLEKNPNLPITPAEVVQQVPSVIFIGLMFSLFFAILFERRVLAQLGVVVSKKDNIGEFRAPDLVVWLFIASLLGAFGQFGIEWVKVVGTNLLNACAVVYFFQGLAVSVAFLNRLSVPPFWRTAILVFFSLQLFLGVSLIGLMDYWFNFRERMKTKSPEVGSET